MANKGIDLTGQRFGRLIAVDRAYVDNRHGWRWNCVCDCGTECVVSSNGLRRGDTKSCGCLNRDVQASGNNRRKHGMVGTRLYRIWGDMKTRCNNPNTEDYERYGGRGIKVCDEWKEDFKAFYDWAMSNGYNDSLSIDRIDYDGNYRPENCRWITNKEQQWNKESTVMVTYEDETRSLSEWAEILGIKRSTLYYRIVIAKWDVDTAFNKKLKGCG